MPVSNLNKIKHKNYGKEKVMPNLTILGLEDNCHSDYQCFVFDGVLSVESPEIKNFINRWVKNQWSSVVKSSWEPEEGEDYRVSIRHINAITDIDNHNINEPHLHL